MSFDPDAAAQPGSGIFGLPFSRDQSALVILPAPFDATTSYGGGTSRAPWAVLAASHQVDLFDHQFGRVYSRGIHMLPIDESILALSREARTAALPIIEKGGAEASDARAISKVNAACERVNDFTHDAFSHVLHEGRTPALLGGDHSTPFGAIKACAEYATKLKPTGLGILQIDAHMDFRDSFEGFTWSHASIMHNVITRIPQVSKLVQVGIRDYGEQERAFADAHKKRIHTCYDLDWSCELLRGQSFQSLCESAIAHLPDLVYISFDIDGLDPSLCPGTGTPVPGGLPFNQVAILLETLARSGRQIIGFDLVEVCPASDETEWDANVGARILYKLCGTALAASQ